MAQELEDGEFWLPSDFLTDDDDLFPVKTKGSHGSSLGFNSDLSSPVDSVMGSTETESDEDDFIAGLTRKIANSAIQDSSFFSDPKPEGLKLSSSPQSTLCAWKQGPNRSSPNSVSKPTGGKDAAGSDLLQSAAILEETTPFYSTPSFFARDPNPDPVYGPPVNNKAQSQEFYHKQNQNQAHLAYLQLQSSTFQLMQHQQQIIDRGDWGQGNIKAQKQRNQGLPMAAWPTLQQPQQQQQQLPGSGMRAVFLGETGLKKERTGTGVFLPRRLGTNPTETPKKPGFSTVLIPERVVHALNLNLESIDAQYQLRGNKNLTPKCGSVAALGKPVVNQANRPGPLRK